MEIVFLKTTIPKIPPKNYHKGVYDIGTFPGGDDTYIVPSAAEDSEFGFDEGEDAYMMPDDGDDVGTSNLKL